MNKNVLIVFASIVCAFVVGCSDAPEVNPVTSKQLNAGGSSAQGGTGSFRVDACVPGQQIACPCAQIDTNGVQVCAEDGQSYGPCTGCPTFPNGSAGQAGSSGTTAQGGSSGVGGSAAGMTPHGGSSGSGSAGSMNAAGSSGSTSTAGAAGNSTAGSGGTSVAGNGGDSGASGVAGSSGAAGEGSSAGNGGSACVPTVTFTTTMHAEDTVMVGTYGYVFFTGDVTANGCADQTINRIDFRFDSPDFTDTDASAYCTGDMQDWNFHNLALTDQDTGAVLSGILGNPAPYASNDLGHLAFTDAFSLKAGETRHVAISMDIPGPLATDIVGKRFGAKFTGLATASDSVVAASDTTPDNGNATFTVVSATQMLEITLDPNAQPAPAIVVGGKSDCVPFSTWSIVNLTGQEQAMTYAFIDQVDPNGDNADFTQVGLIINGSTVFVGNATNPQGDWYVDGSPSTPAITILPNAQMDVQVCGVMANVLSSQDANGAWHGVARSGHTPSLALKGVMTKQANGTVWQSANAEQPGSMVLRKSMPVVTQQALTSNTLANGDQDLISFQIAADPAGSIGLKQMVFNVDVKGLFITQHFHVRRGDTDMDPSTYALVTNGLTVGQGDIINPAYCQTPGDCSGYKLIFSLSDEEVISGSGNVYTLHADVSGVTDGCSLDIQPQLLLPSAPAGLITGQLVEALPPYLSISGSTPATLPQMFIWSDMSEVPHGANAPWTGNPTPSSADWTNGMDLTGFAFGVTLKSLPFAPSYLTASIPSPEPRLFSFSVVLPQLADDNGDDD